MTITLRNNKGAALTYGEVDENFRDLRYDTTLDRVLTNGNSAITKSMTVNEVNSNDITANNITANTITATSGSLTIPNLKVTQSLAIPFGSATGTSSGSPGQLKYDGTNLYLCVGTNQWMKVALSAI